MFTCKFKYANITCTILCESVHMYCRFWLFDCQCCLFWFSSRSVCMHSCCISHLWWVFLLMLALHLHGSVGLHMQVHTVSSWACVCEVWVFVCVLTLASCSCRGSLVASGQLSSWERCSHTIWANLSTLPLSACSNSHAWHTHVHTHTHICPHKHPHVHIRYVYIETQRHTYTNTHTHAGQREDGSVSGTGEPQLVTTATRSARLA